MACIYVWVKASIFSSFETDLIILGDLNHNEDETVSIYSHISNYNLLRILANLNKHIICMLSILPIYYYYYNCEFFTPVITVNDSKSPYINRTLLSIMAYFNSSAMWMISRLSQFI